MAPSVTYEDSDLLAHVKYVHVLSCSMSDRTGLQIVSTVAPVSYGLVQATRIGQKCHHRK